MTSQKRRLQKETDSCDFNRATSRSPGNCSSSDEDTLIIGWGLQVSHASGRGARGDAMRCKRQRQKPQAKEKELSELKSHFISTASHEFSQRWRQFLSSADMLNRLQVGRVSASDSNCGFLITRTEPFGQCFVSE